MIILKHLTIERFRLLRSMNLHFPQRGSILIQGPNEAGKSALIESIYFALYGEPLLLGRGKHLLDDLIDRDVLVDIKRRPPECFASDDLGWLDRPITIDRRSGLSPGVPSTH